MIETYNDYAKLSKYLPKNQYDTWIKSPRILSNPKLKYEIIKDRKWKDNNINNLHLLIIYKSDKLKSIRDIKSQDIKTIDQSLLDAKKIMEDKYKLSIKNCHIYFHYHPSIWQLHLHIVNCLKKDNHPEEFISTRTHYYTDIKNNLEKYQKGFIMIDDKYRFKPNILFKKSIVKKKV